MKVLAIDREQFLYYKKGESRVSEDRHRLFGRYDDRENV